MALKVAKEKEVENEDTELVLSELGQEIWSVVSFEKSIKNGLTYDEAVKTLEQCLSKKISGLCIITDEAAKNL